METILSIMAGYLLGSFPTAFIVIKKRTGLDITENGSGNVGAHNSYDVTKSKPVGVFVLLIDLLKGFLAVLLVKLFFDDSFLNEILALTAAVFSHCYSPWIKFKGGRGLATTTGGGLLLSIPILLLWAIVWAITFIFRKNIHFANFSASMLTIVLSFTSAKILINYANPIPDSELQFSIFVSVLFLIIISKHIQPLKEYFATQQNIKLKEQKDESI